MMSLDFTYIVGASIGVVGVLEWAKGFAIFSKLPAWVWRAVSPFACAGVGIAGGGEWPQMATNAILLLAVSQIGYPVLIQLPTALIEKFRKALGS